MATYVRNTKGLQRYQEARRNAKAIGGAYKEYVDQFYKVSKNLRVHGVKIASTHAIVYSPKQFAENMKLNPSNVGKMVADQFGLMSGNKSRVLQSKLAAKGKKITLQRASVRQLSGRNWAVIDEYYHERLAEGLSASDAKTEIAKYFFDSE